MRNCGAIALLSSSVNVNGMPAAGARTMANGMRGPSIARANTNKVSPGRMRLASTGVT